MFPPSLVRPRYGPLMTATLTRPPSTVDDGALDERRFVAGEVDRQTRRRRACHYDRGRAAHDGLFRVFPIVAEYGVRIMPGEIALTRSAFRAKLARGARIVAMTSLPRSGLRPLTAAWAPSAGPGNRSRPSCSRPRITMFPPAEPNRGSATVCDGWASSSHRGGATRRRHSQLKAQRTG